MKPLLLLFVLAASASAQSGQERLDKLRKDFGMKTEFRVPPEKQVFFKNEPVPTGRCSVPLLEVTPPSRQGTMVILPVPESTDRMPKVQAPAPPCK